MQPEWPVESRGGDSTSLMRSHIGFWSEIHLPSVFFSFPSLQTRLSKRRNSSANMDPFSFPLHFGAGPSRRPWSEHTDRARFNISCQTVKQTAAARVNSPPFISPLPSFLAFHLLFLVLVFLISSPPQSSDLQVGLTDSYCCRHSVWSCCCAMLVNARSLKFSFTFLYLILSNK